MSEFDIFLKCPNCPRRFLTKTGFLYHSTNVHNNENLTQLNQFLRTPTKNDERASQKDATFEKECFICNKSFGSKLEKEVHINIVHKKHFKKEVGNKKPSTNQCKKSNEAFSLQCQECEFFFGERGTLLLEMVNPIPFQMRGAIFFNQS